MRKISVSLAALLSLSVFGAVQHRWQCETSGVNEEAVTAYRGETVELQCKMTSYGQVVAPCRGTDAAFLWQTNGMGNAWWSTNATFASGTLRANWTPFMDVGADSYRFFFHVSDAKGTCYRANGTMAMLGSPAGEPSLVPLPQKLAFSVETNVLTITHGTNVWRLVAE